jgi:hypothetical protein
VHKYKKQSSLLTSFVKIQAKNASQSMNLESELNGSSKQVEDNESLTHLEIFKYNDSKQLAQSPQRIDNQSAIENQLGKAQSHCKLQLDSQMPLLTKFLNSKPLIF